MFDSQAPARTRSFPILITCIPRAGLVELEEDKEEEEEKEDKLDKLDLVEEKEDKLDKLDLVEEEEAKLDKDKVQGSISVSVGVFGLYGEINLTSSLDLQR